MGKVSALALMFFIVFLSGCSSAKKSDSKVASKIESAKKTEIVQVEKKQSQRFLNAKKSDGMTVVITKGKIQREKEFGTAFNEGIESGMELSVTGDLIMVVLDYTDGGGQALMAEYDNCVKFKNREISLDEFMDGIIIKDMSDEEVKKARNVF